MIAQFKKGTYRWSILAIILLAVLGSVALTNGRTIKGDSSALVKIMPQDLYKNLVLYYSFDKDGGTKVVDISGMDFHGKVHGASWIEEGVTGGAMSFDGKDDYISIGEMYLKAVTLSAWVKVLVPETPVITENRRDFGREGVALPGKAWYRKIDNRRIFLLDNGKHFYKVELNNRGGVGFCASGQRGIQGVHEYDWSFVRDQWTHIVVTYDGRGKVNIYKNGKLTEAGEDAVTFITELRGTAYIGGLSTYDGEFWHGMLDEVALFNRALSEPQVGQLYRIASGLGTESVKIKPTGLVGHWSFDNDDGDTVIDSSPHSNHGKLKTAVKETAIAKWASQKNVSKLLNEADSFVTQMAQAKEREDWRSVDVRAQKLWYILRKLKTTLPRGTLGRALESRITFSPEAPQHYRERVPELNDCISRLDELCDDLHSGIRDKKMSVVSEIYQEFNKQWTHFNSIMQFKPGDGKTGPTLVDGILGKAYYFDGVDDYVDCGNNASLDITDKITISAWVNFNTLPLPSPYPTNYPMIVSKKLAYNLGYHHGDDKWYFQIYDSGGSKIAYSNDIVTGNYQLGVWYHFVGVMNGSQNTLYINALEQQHANPSGMVSLPATPVNIGRYSDGYYIDALIDEVAIYDRALSAEEIRQLYNLTNLEEQDSTRIQPSKPKPTGPQWVLYQRPNAGANYALKFDGLDDFVQVPRSESLEPTEEITVELWAFLDGGQNRNARLVRKAGAMAPGYLLAADQTGDRTMQFRIDRGRGNITRAADNQTNLAHAGQWHHFAGVYSRTHARFYIDGIEVSKIRHDEGKIYHSSVDLYIGHGAPGPNEHFKGAIDEVRIWSIARSQVDIQEDMYRTLNGSEAGLVGYWKFDEGKGDTVQDSSGKGNHGKLGQTQRRTPRTRSNKVLDLSRITSTIETPVNTGLVAYWNFDGNAKEK